MKNIYLNQFTVVKPPHRIAQNELLQWLIQSHIKAEKLKTPDLKEDDSNLLKKLFERYAVKETQISQRYFECPDILNSNLDEAQIYSVNEKNLEGSSIQDRTLFFSNQALRVLKEMYPANQKQPEHLVHVTCTGYISPSAPQRIVTENFWTKDTGITHAYHMGCYAALPAIRIAQSLVALHSEKQPQYQADIVHNEMCGLHMNPLFQTPEQMIVQTLFADGHIKYSASAEKNSNTPNLKIVTVKEKIVKDSHLDMSWMPTAWGMQMNLSREVPQKIKAELKTFFNEIIQEANLSLSDALKSTFAVHPGGPKIIDSVQEVLELQDHQVALSKKVLFERGNMSSATLPHVWTEILEAKPKIGEKIISFAFGPGLTIFGAVFEVC